jgi:hypothetical protein
MAATDVSSHATYVPDMNFFRAAARTLFPTHQTQGAGCEQTR